MTRADGQWSEAWWECETHGWTQRVPEFPWGCTYTPPSCSTILPTESKAAGRLVRCGSPLRIVDPADPEGWPNLDG